MADDGRDRVAAVHLAILGGLCVVLYWSQLQKVLDYAVRDRDWAHGLAVPVLAGLLLYLRADALRRSRPAGSLWGVALIGLALLLNAAFAWPYQFAYPRMLSIVPALAGIVLTTHGWRVLRLVSPILLLVAVSVPVPARQFAAMVITPETLTLKAVQQALDALPGVIVMLEGLDLSFTGKAGSGTIALGEPYRGASLFMAYATIGIFVTFARIRPWWHLALLALAAAPIVLTCNFLRLLCWGLVTIWTGADPVAATPRIAASVASMLAAWGLFALVVFVASRMVQEPE